MRTRARLYWRAEDLYRKSLGALRALHTGPWLGLLDVEDLHAITAEQYRRMERYASDDYNSSDLQHWELAALKRHFPPGGSVLVLSAGGAREVAALERRGYAVAAYECSPRLVDAGNRFLESQGLSSCIAPCAPSTVPPGAGTGFDAALVGWGGYMHVPGRDRRVAFLAGIHEALKKGAPVLLSFYVRSPTSRSDLWTARLANAVRALRGSGERAQPGDHVQGSFDHHFTEDEIRSEIQAAGFRVAEFQGGSSPWAVGVR